MEIKVLNSRLREAEKALSKLIKRANRTKNTNIEYKVLPEILEEKRTICVKEYNADGRLEDRILDKKVEVRVLEVTGAAPTMEGYRFIGKVETLEDGDILVSSVDDNSVVDNKFYDNPNTSCQHCNTNRKRNDVYIVQNEKTLEQIQVGKTCLRDFLGIDDPSSVLSKYNFIAQLRGFEEDEDAWIQKSDNGFNQSLHHVVQTTLYVLTEEKYKTVREAEEEGVAPTSFTVLNSLNTSWWCDGDNPTEEEEQLWREVNKKSKLIINWFRNELDPQNDFEQKLKTLYSKDVVYKEHHMGVVCYGIVFWKKAMAKKLEDAKKANSNFVGEPKKRLKGLQLDYKGSFYMGTSNYGYYPEKIYLHKFADAEDNVYVWKTTNGCVDQDLGSKKVVLDGTVKEHKEFNGEKQTVLTRCKYVLENELNGKIKDIMYLVNY